MQDELMLARAKREANKLVSYFMQQRNGLWYLMTAASQMPHFEDQYQEEIRKTICKKASSLYHNSSLAL